MQSVCTHSHHIFRAIFLFLFCSVRLLNPYPYHFHSAVSHVKIHIFCAQLTVDNHTEVVEILKGAKEKWYTFGVLLGIAVADLDTIHEEQAPDMETRLTKLMSIWLQNGKNCTWQAVYDALRHHIVQLPDVAEKVKEKYMTKYK